MTRMGENRPEHLIGQIVSPENLDRYPAVPTGIIARLLVIEIVQEPGQPPYLLILPESPRQCPHDRFDGEYMLDQILFREVPVDQSHRFVSRNHGWASIPHRWTPVDVREVPDDRWRPGFSTDLRKFHFRFIIQMKIVRDKLVFGLLEERITLDEGFALLE